VSVDATSWAWQQKTGKSTAKAVLLALADRAGADNTAWPSMATIAKDTEQDRKTVNASLRVLLAGGFIEDTGKRKGSTGKVVVYRLIGVNNRHEDHENKQYRKRNSTEKGSIGSAPQTSTGNGPIKQHQKRNSTENGTVPNSPTNSTENGTLNSTENGTQNLSVEPISEPVVVPDVDLNTQVVTESVDDDNTKPSLFDMDLKPASQISTSPSVEMDFHWQPTKSFYERCKMGGVRLDALSAAEQEESLCNFRSHHESTGVSNRQPRWEHLLMGWVKRDIARKLGSTLSDSAATKQDKRASVTAGVMNVADTSW